MQSRIFILNIANLFFLVKYLLQQLLIILLILQNVLINQFYFFFQLNVLQFFKIQILSKEIKLSFQFMALIFQL